MIQGPNSWEPFDDLNSFVDVLRKEDDLIEVSQEVSARYEIGAVLWELGERNGAAALFNNIKEHPGKIIVGNLMGHRSRLAKVLGVRTKDLASAYIERKKRRIAPVQTSEDVPVKDVHIRTHDIDLFKVLPALVHHEKDTSPYLTTAVTFAKDPDADRQSMGLHRIQIRSDNLLSICLETPPLSHFLGKAKQMGKALEVAVVLGPDPAVLLAAVTWCPEGDDKIEIAGALREKPVQMVECETVNLKVPGYSQYVIEGRIEPNEIGKEGVFGESSGIYVREVMSPIIRVTHISHRKLPLYQALVPWSSEDDALFSLCFGSDILESVQSEFPFVKDLYLLPGTCGSHIVISVNDYSKPMLRLALHAILIRNPFVKMVIAVGEDIDIRNLKEVEWALATRFQADKDLFTIQGVQGSVIDPSVASDGASCKVGIDATIPKDKKNTFEKINFPPETKKKALAILDRVLG